MFSLDNDIVRWYNTIRVGVGNISEKGYKGVTNGL